MSERLLPLGFQLADESDREAFRASITSRIADLPNYPSDVLRFVGEEYQRLVDSITAELAPRDYRQSLIAPIIRAITPFLERVEPPLFAPRQGGYHVAELRAPLDFFPWGEQGSFKGEFVVRGFTVHGPIIWCERINRFYKPAYTSLSTAAILQLYKATEVLTRDDFVFIKEGE